MQNLLNALKGQKVARDLGDEYLEELLVVDFNRYTGELEVEDADGNTEFLYAEDGLFIYSEEGNKDIPLTTWIQFQVGELSRVLAASMTRDKGLVDKGMHFSPATVYLEVDGQSHGGKEEGQKVASDVKASIKEAGFRAKVKY